MTSPAQDNDPANADDDPFRRAMFVRKKRSKDFLDSDLAAFNLLLVLTFHHYMSRIQQAAFSLHDGDKSGIDLKASEKQQARKKKRLLFKGAEHFHAPPVLRDREPSLLDVYSQSRDIINLFWRLLTMADGFDQTLFCVPAAFWPSSLSEDAKLSRLSSDIMKTIAGLQWRILYRAKMAPYSLLQLADPSFPDDVAEERVESFLQTPSCCLDSFWGQPVKDHILAEDPENQLFLMKEHIHNFAKNSRGVTSREESLHAVQRRKAGGWSSAPIPFRKQASMMVLHTSSVNFVARGGRDHKFGAPSPLKKASRMVRKREVKHVRPRQLGNPVFFYMQAARKNGSTLTNKELNLEFKNLVPAEKDMWSRRSRLHVARKRWVDQQVKAEEADKPAAQPPQSPWDLGDNRYPLKTSCLELFLQNFQQKNVGIENLKKFEQHNMEVATMLKKISQGQQYHSRDAATAFSRAMLGEQITEQNCLDGSWKHAAEGSRVPKPCGEEHPGVCKSIHAAMLPKIQAFCQTLPKVDCILMMELHGSRRQCDRIALFFRMVVGPGWERHFSFDCVQGWAFRM